MPHKQQGAILILAIGMMVVMAILSSILMHHMTSSSELITQALRYHHAKKALWGHMVGYQQALLAKQEPCDKKQVLSKAPWQGYQIEMTCRLKDGLYNIDGTISAISPTSLPVKTTASLSFGHV